MALESRIYTLPRLRRGVFNSRGLVRALTFYEGHGKGTHDLGVCVQKSNIASNIGTLTGNANWETCPGGGRAFKFDGSTYLDYPKIYGIRNPAHLTLGVSYLFRAKLNQTLALLAGFCDEELDNNTGASAQLIFFWSDTGNGLIVQAVAAGSELTSESVVLVTNPDVSKWHDYLVRWKGATLEVWVDGKKNSTAGSGLSYTGGQLRIASRSPDFTSQQSVALLLQWNRFIDPSEVWDL